MNRKGIIDIIGESISSLSDKDFTSLCDRLIHKLFPEAVKSPTISDNGYAVIDNSFFTIIPMDNEEIPEPVSLIPVSFSEENCTSLVFISKDTFQLTEEQRKSIRQIIGKVRLDLWCLETIKLKLSVLSDSDLHFILGTDSQFAAYLSEEQNELDEFDVIRNIFSFIKQNAQAIKTIPQPNDDKYKGIKKKIKLNFSDYQSRVFDMYQLTLYYKTLVEKYIQEFTKYDKTEVVVLREFFRSKYLEIANVHWTTHPVNEYRYLEQLAQACTEEKFKGNKKYQLYAKAVVMYFFEICDFGARNKKETLPPEDPILFDNLNEDLN